ncbi:cation:proton antiporter [Lacisediminihabitans changchengi]|uniref:Cation:proton antiporter n=1 Tax=Lacisediminihabitans changchengi TaxID=2787634 RepID=A0A934STN9_9MICO|nr:cation:proton antiporter [Lacisediminihabitans changchengi]MBK4348788.1 cation:proton antiporter [Lacisediminihabitans changchengi]
MNHVEIISWIVAFVLVTVAMTGLGRRIGWPTPLILVALGGIASFIPGVPSITIDPDLILYGLLPPLLFAAARNTYLADIRQRRDSILVISIGTVAATVVVVGFTASLILPTIGLAAAFAFAAVIAPTDTVAVTAVAHRMGLPRRAITILEGESLLNDAAALVALNAALLALTGSFTPLALAGNVVLAVAGGVVVGGIVGWLTALVRARIRVAVLDTSLALITPYLAFLAAQAIHGSGILAVVIAGLYLGYLSPKIQTAECRSAELANWRTVQFILENAVFLFIGLNLSSAVSGVSLAGYGLWSAVGICATILLALVAARFAFVYAVAWFFRMGPRRLRDQHVQWKSAFIVSSVSVRGVVTLAAAFLLPPETPDRALLQFLAFVVVVATISGSALLPAVIRLARVSPPDSIQEQMEWRSLLAEVRAAGVDALESELTDNDDVRVISQLRAGETLVQESLDRQLANPDEESLLASYERLRRRMIRAEWYATIKARAEGRFPETAVIKVLEVIDAEEAALRAFELEGQGSSSPVRRSRSWATAFFSRVQRTPPSTNRLNTRQRDKRHR